MKYHDTIIHYILKFVTNESVDKRFGKLDKRFVGDCHDQINSNTDNHAHRLQ